MQDHAAQRGNAADAALIEISMAYVTTFSGREWGLCDDIKEERTYTGVSITYRVRTVRCIGYEESGGT